MDLAALRLRRDEIKRLQDQAAAHFNFVSGQVAEIEAWIAALDSQRVEEAARARADLEEKVRRLAEMAGATEAADGEASTPVLVVDNGVIETHPAPGTMPAANEGA